MGDTVKLMLQLELVGTSMDEETLVCVHGAKFEAGAGGVEYKGGHLVLILNEEDAIVSFTNGL